ncbi:MAG: class 1 fructose-bisphosphatase [Gammaproteobacteria bacterium]|nr:class 1 fructose-bisphosphatase [Gammaproteobacteria bacterium]MCP5425615.1 class 1 fructose-bisphosphatase [Gammaproteobacteria bacterium]MCP5458985.1 class 1 fructose-bisphosphatase [Gammaproteobacteria bacterium]
MIGTIGTTITEFIIAEQRRFAGATGDFTSLINDIVIACKTIASAVKYGKLSAMDVLGSTDTENVQGEKQKKLDVISNDLFIKRNEWSGYVAAMASEEMDGVYHLPKQFPRGKYLLVYDPLDGSSNTEVNGAIGTIFSILRRPGNAEGEPDAKEFMQPGTQQICAGYALYGPSTMMVLTSGFGVNGFTLDQRIGEFILSHPDMRIPEDTNEFAINAAYTRFWDPPMKRYMDECLAGKEGPRDKDFNMRWAGAMIADVHRVLSRGGIFMYPMDRKMRAKGATGKLRLLYEANPMGFIVEQAGGAASTGTERILEIQPHDLHQRCPVIMGSKNEVERVVSYHKEFAQA